MAMNENYRSQNITIGWKESISFIEWGIKHLVAKTDTGARTSVIDCENVKVSVVNGSKLVDFDVILDRKNRRNRLRITNVPVKSETKVKSSNGHMSVRVRVTTSVKIGDQLLNNVDFTLSPRPSMLCPVLIGRDAIKGKFIVDSHHKYVLSKKRYRTKTTKPHRRHITTPIVNTMIIIQPEATIRANNNNNNNNNITNESPNI
jgi:hypothetical protein